VIRPVARLAGPLALGYAGRVEPRDLTVRILEDIRDEIRGLRQEQQQFRQEQQQFRQETTARFEIIETTLRDLAQQLVVLGRGLEVAIKQRATTDARLDDHDRRIRVLEGRPTAGARG
jgi:chromosome segregation ATPase